MSALNVLSSLSASTMLLNAASKRTGWAR